MPIFGPKCQFWAKFGRFWAQNPIFWGQGVKILVPSYRDSNETPFSCWKHWSVRLQFPFPFPVTALALPARRPFNKNAFYFVVLYTYYIILLHRARLGKSHLILLIHLPHVTSSHISLGKRLPACLNAVWRHCSHFPIRPQLPLWHNSKLAFKETTHCECCVKRKQGRYSQKDL